MHTTLIRNADVLDGTGAPAIKADLLLEGDRMAAIGHLEAARADTDLDAAGLVAAPGFIDIHSHSDFTLPINGRAESKIRQGVTTEVVGMCGASPAQETRRRRPCSCGEDRSRAGAAELAVVCASGPELTVSVEPDRNPQRFTGPGRCRLCRSFDLYDP